MSKNKKIGIVVWILGLMLSMVLLFCLENGLTATFWITFAFVCAAFVSTMIFQLQIWKKADIPDEQFLHLPAIAVSYIYIIAQIPICIIFALGSGAIPYKVAILVNAVLLIIAWILALSALAGNDHIQNVNGRQKDHHTEL